MQVSDSLVLSLAYDQLVQQRPLWLDVSALKNDVFRLAIAKTDYHGHYWSGMPRIVGCVRCMYLNDWNGDCACVTMTVATSAAGEDFSIMIPIKYADELLTIVHADGTWTLTNVAS